MGIGGTRAGSWGPKPVVGPEGGGPVGETTCAGCGAEPRSGRARLGKRCLAAARKAARVGQPVGQAVSDSVSDMSDTGVGHGVSDRCPHESDAGHEPGGCVWCLQAMVEGLEAEVRRLKREVAERAKAYTGLGAEVNALLARPSKASGHPVFCQGVCCR